MLLSSLRISKFSTKAYTKRQNRNFKHIQTYGAQWRQANSIECLYKIGEILCSNLIEHLKVLEQKEGITHRVINKQTQGWNKGNTNKQNNGESMKQRDGSLRETVKNDKPFNKLTKLRERKDLN